MDLSQVLRTTFAAREFLDEPVPDEALVRILDAARFAPSGGNRQGWRVIAVREQATKDAIAELGKPAMRRYFAQIQAGGATVDEQTEQLEKPLEQGYGFFLQTYFDDYATGELGEG